jgi:hypothetical protein
MTMEEYLFRVYLKRRCLSTVTITKSRNAVRNFDKFAGRIERLDQRHVDAFREWLINRGLQTCTAKNYTDWVRPVAREWFPRGPWRHFVDADLPGTLDQVFVGQFAQRRLRPITDADTTRRYGSTLHLFGQYLDRPAMLTDLTAARVAGFLGWLKKERGSGDWNTAHHAMRLGSLWRWAWRNDLVENPPTWRAS